MRTAHINVLKQNKNTKATHIPRMSKPLKRMLFGNEHAHFRVLICLHWSLCDMPGHHISMNRGEAMHAGPLGSMPDAAATALIELCEEGDFGFLEVTPWRDRLTSQLIVAWHEFSTWCSENSQQHTLRRFTCARFSMNTLRSWPMFKGKASNCLILTRWLESRCFAKKNDSEWARLRWLVIWAWTDWFDICLEADPDYLKPEELLRLDRATRILLTCSKTLASRSCALGQSRWKIRAKLHVMFHLNLDAQANRRNPRSWWSFKEEETMGKLSRIAAATHAVTLATRTLERWCVQFFGYMES